MKCPCCLNKTLKKRGDNEICQTCFWEDEGDFDREDHEGYLVGPNFMTLVDYRNRWIQETDRERQRREFKCSHQYKKNDKRY